MEEIWDENQWEDFLREADRRTDLYLRLLEAYVREHPPPPEDAPEPAHEAWQRALDEHLARRMGWTIEEAQDPPLWLPPTDEPEPEEGESWKAALPELYPEGLDLHSLPHWRMANAFAQSVLSWADTIPSYLKDDVLVDVCANALHIPARLAGAHQMGYEPETLGGNIAVTKRGLSAANRALVSLHLLSDAPFVREADYRRLYEQGFEVRNAVALHVLALRERFEQG